MIIRLKQFVQTLFILGGFQNWDRQSHSWLDLISAMAPLWTGDWSRHLQKSFPNNAFVSLWYSAALLCSWAIRRASDSDIWDALGYVQTHEVSFSHLFTVKRNVGLRFPDVREQQGQAALQGRGAKSRGWWQGRQGLWPPQQEVRKFRQSGSGSGPGTVIWVSLSSVPALQVHGIRLVQGQARKSSQSARIRARSEEVFGLDTQSCNAAEAWPSWRATAWKQIPRESLEGRTLFLAFFTVVLISKGVDFGLSQLDSLT